MSFNLAAYVTIKREGRKGRKETQYSQRPQQPLRPSRIGLPGLPGLPDLPGLYGTDRAWPPGAVFDSDSTFANSRYAPGTAYGSCRWNA